MKSPLPKLSVVLSRHLLALLAFAALGTADPLFIGKIPAHRTVKISFAVKVNDNFPHSSSQISNGVTVTSSDGGTIVLPALTQVIYYTPNIPTDVTVPSGGISKDTRPALSGIADPNTTIEIYDGNSLIGTATTDAAGGWTFVPTQALSYGVHNLKIRSVNGSQLSDFSNNFELRIDCPPGVYGVTCSNVCPGGLGSSACSGHGVCSDGIAGSGNCTCAAGSFDAACSRLSNVCQVNLGDGVYVDSEWNSVKAILNTNNDVNGDTYYWKGKWTRREQSSFRYSSDPKAWAAISDVKSCLGSQDGMQVLYLLMQSQFPLASYYDSHDGNNYRFGLGTLTKGAVPTHQLINAVWKMMASPTGSVYYIVLSLEYNEGDTFKNIPFRSLKLYKESAGDSFNATNFAKQTFNPDTDSFVADLGNIVQGLSPQSPSTDDRGLPAIETGVDLLKLLAATGWSPSTPFMVQGLTQNVKDATPGRVALSEIDRTGTVTIPDLTTQKALAAPSVRLKRNSRGNVTLRCQPPADVQAKNFFFRIVRNASNQPVYYSSKSATITAKVIGSSAYKALCYYQTNVGQRSDPSDSVRFKAK